jgi:hypothetical protein
MNSMQTQLLCSFKADDTKLSFQSVLSMIIGYIIHIHLYTQIQKLDYNVILVFI